MTLRALATRGALVAGASAAALGLVEVALRVLHVAEPGGIATVTVAEFARVPGIHRPNQHERIRENPHLPHTVTIDSLGYRGPSFPREKPPGKTRIFLLGDSFTYGSFVDDTLTLPAQLQRGLAATCPGTRVINGGLAGSTIADQVYLARRALPLGLDMVVLLFSENDVGDLRQTPLWDRLAENRVAKSRPPISLLYPAVRRTALWNLLLQARARWATRTASPSAPTVRREWPTDERDQYRELFTQLHDSLAAHGIPLATAAFPSHLTLLGERGAGQLAWFRDLSHSLDVPSLNLADTFLATGRPITEFYLLPHDGHPSGEGYRVGAAALASWTVGGRGWPCVGDSSSSTP